MEKHTVFIGSELYGNGGQYFDETQEVEFVGELLATVERPGYHKDRVTDTRGTTQRLYTVEGGGYVVHEKEWSRWQGEATVYALHRVTLEELQGGDWYQLARAAGLVGALSLDDALGG